MTFVNDKGTFVFIKPCERCRTFVDVGPRFSASAGKVIHCCAGCSG